MIRPKPKRARENAPWRPRRIRLDAKGMRELRHECFARANGLCEACGKPASWWFGEMHHVRKRSQGGSDEISNVIWLCKADHKRLHPGPQFNWAWTGRKFA